MTLHFDDQFPSFREVDGLSDTAFRLHVTAFFWIRTNRTDGLVRTEDLALVCARVRAPERFAAECVQRGAWHDARHDCGSRHCLGAVDADGYVVHDYLKDNPSKAELEAEESGKSRGGKRGNHRRWHVAKGKTAPGCEFCEEEAEAGGPPRRAPQKRTSHKRSHTDRISDSGATPIDRSDHLYLHQDQSEEADQSKSDARARADDALVADIASTVCAEHGFVPDGDRVRSVIAAIEDRARKAGTRMRNRYSYVKRAAKAPDLWELPPAPPGDSPAGAPPVPTEGDRREPPAWPVPDSRDPRRHEFTPSPMTGVCWCNSTRNSPKHYADQARPSCTA